MKHWTAHMEGHLGLADRRSRPCMPHSILLPMAVLGALLSPQLWNTADAQVRVASEKRTYTPLEKYRRTELLVRPDFEANCRQKKQVVKCRVSGVPEHFPELMVGLRGGNTATVELIEIGKRIEVHFKLKQAQLRFQHKVFSSPKRWVIEIGIPLTLTKGVLKEQVFQPYPIAVSSIDAKLPPMRIHELEDTSEANRQLNECYGRWLRNDLNDALDRCQKVADDWPNSAASVMAKKLIAETLLGQLDLTAEGTLKTPDKLERAQDAFDAAEEAAFPSDGDDGRGLNRTSVIASPEDGARYVLLKANALEAQGFVNQAEQVLSDAEKKYESTSAAGYLLAARARMFMTLKDGDSARRVLEKLRSLRSDDGTVGTALLALAELAYNEHKFVTAVGLFDSVKDRWPNLLASHSSALFRAGELYMLYGRIDDAREAYLSFLNGQIRSLLRFGEHSKAQELAEMLTKEYPNHLDSKRNLIRVLLKSGQYSKAEGLLNEYLKERPNDVSAINDLAVITARTSGRQRSAIEIAKRAQSADPNNARTKKILAILESSNAPTKNKEKSIHRDSAIAGLEGSLGEVEGEYEFENSRLAPDWLVHIRLNEILSYSDPEKARTRFREFAASQDNPIAQNLAFFSLAALTPKTLERKRLIKSLSTIPTTSYLYQHLVIAAGQLALADGNLFDAFRYGFGLYDELPEAYVIKHSPSFFDRLLLLKLLELIESKNDSGVLDFYYEKIDHFEGHSLRGEVHLLVAQALRRMAMYAEADSVLQKGIGGRTAELEKDATARIYREMASNFRDQHDVFRLGEILKYLDARHPDRFDDPEYWLSKAYYARATNKNKEARKILVYAINGPDSRVTTEQRLKLVSALAELYVDMEKPKKADKALRTYIKIHDEKDGGMNSLERRDARWQIAEIWIEEENWPKAVDAIQEFKADYPVDQNLPEAQFYLGRAYSEMGLFESAKKQWHQLSEEKNSGLYGRLARLELEMLSWRTFQLPEILDNAQL